MDKNKGFGVVSGAAAYIAAQRKEAEHENTERLIHNMSNDFPALARIYAKVKEEKKCM
jgi:hypothetical protein